MMESLMKHLMSESRRELFQASVTTGKVPQTGAGDFDLCFHFVLPSYAVASTDERIVKEAKDENEQFLTRIAERHKDKQNAKSVQENAEALFRDIIYFHEDQEGFDCGIIRNLEDARIACIDLINNFFFDPAAAFVWTYMFTSIDHDELFLCVKLQRDFALNHALKWQYPLQLDMSMVTSNDGLGISFEEGGKGDQAALNPAYVLYRRRLLKLLRKYESECNTEVTDPLRKIDYIRLLYDIVSRRLNLEMMKQYGLLRDYYPLHSKSRLLWFHKEWATLGKWYCFHQPFDEIRNYFGEDIAFYFVFAQHLCQYTVVLCGVGVFILVVNLVTNRGGDFSDVQGVLATFGGYNGLQQMVPAYILFLIVFTNVFIFHLRRKIAYWKNVWGMECGINSLVQKKLNPRFISSAKWMRSEVNSNIFELQVEPRQRARGQIYSMIGTFLFICLLLCTVSALFEAKAALIANGNAQLAMYVSYGTTFQIKVFRAIWVLFNRIFTDLEYHRDQADFYMYCALKTQFVVFVYCYSSFYYIAFVMQILGDTSYVVYGSTWQYLTYQMFTTFIVYFIFSGYDLVRPWLDLRRSKAKELQNLKASGKVPEGRNKLCYSFLELQTKMENYDGRKQNADYMELIGVFGFVIIFGITNLLCSFLALLYIALQIRVDAWKITHAMRRPYPEASHGDFLWLNIIERYVCMAMLTNIGLMCFCWTTFAGYSFRDKLLTFVVLASIALALRNVGSCLFSDASRDVMLARKRHAMQQQSAQSFQEKNPRVHRFVPNCRTNINLDVPPLCRSDSKGIFETPPGEHESDDENVS